MKRTFKQFFKDEGGTASIEFVLLFPFFFAFFLMTYEAGVFGTRQVSLEHGVDVTVREVRLGNIAFTDRVQFSEDLRTEVCENARILPDCLNQLEIELIQRDMAGAWVPLPQNISCVDRTDLVRPEQMFLDNVGSNDLAFLRACIRIDPFLPTSNLGKAFVEADPTNDAAGGSYALLVTSAIVVEPSDEDDS